MRGFVTMATGNEKYFVMAKNLLNSYLYFTKRPYRFAIISDRKNEYTELFDDVVIIDDATCSYMDKIRILKNCPYDENIFIDADCLAYKDLNEYWECFSESDDFSCFGKALQLDSDKGLFLSKDVGRYKNKIHFTTHLHGVLYFVRNGKKCEEILQTSLEIIDNYQELYFKDFKEPADESVFALAMAIHNCLPVKRESRYYIFYPIAKYCKMDIFTGFLSYEIENERRIEDGMLVHWANVNVSKPLYKFESEKLNSITKKRNIKIKLLYNCKLKYLQLKTLDYLTEKKLIIKYYIKRLKVKIWRN